MSTNSVFFRIFSCEVQSGVCSVKMCKNMSVILLVCLFNLVTILDCKPISPDEHPLQYYFTSNSSRARRSSDFAFPDDDNDSEDPSAPLLIPTIPGRPSCAVGGGTYCEHFEPYPRAQLKRILRERAIGKELFGMDEGPSGEAMAARDGDAQDTFVCGAVENTVFPKLGINKDNRWQYIINQPEDGYVQGVRIEVCRSYGKPCDVIGETPSDYITSCKQKFIYRRLLSLTKTGIPFQDTFKLPSACCCTYKKNFNFLSEYSKRMSKR